MGRNKFEKQLQEQLQERKITPSKDAWYRISQELEASDTPKSKKFHWYGIAAGFIGILFISILYYTIDGVPTDTQIQITDIEKDNDPALNSVPKIIEKQNFKELNTNEENATEEALIVDTEVIDKETKQSNSKPYVIKNDVLTSTDKEESEIKKSTVALNESEALIDAKIAEIAAQVAVLENNNSVATDAEIDSLLRVAQREILEDKIFRKDKSVDAMALLADVEDELDQSFRDQIFDALKDGFLKIRTAVANRNK